MESILNRNSIVWQFGETKVSTRGRPTSVVSRPDCCAVAAASLVPGLLRLDTVPFLPPSSLCGSFQRRHNELNWTQNGKKAEENGKNMNASTSSVAIEKEL